MIHQLSDVQSKNIGKDTNVWQYVVILEKAVIGCNCNICSHCFIENDVVNWSHGDPKVRIHVPVGVAYGSDLQLVTDSLLEVAAQHPSVLNRPAPTVRFLEFADSSLNVDLLVWIDRPSASLTAQSSGSPRTSTGTNSPFT